MLEEKHIISITKDQGTPSQQIIDINTSGFLILYLDKNKVKMLGDLELKALAPLLMKMAMEKVSGA